MECICGNDLTDKKEEISNVKFEFKNPGTVEIECKNIRCDKCGEQYIDEKDSNVIYTELERKYEKTHSKNPDL